MILHIPIILGLSRPRIRETAIRSSSHFYLPFSLLSLNPSPLLVPLEARLFASLEDRVRQFATPRYKNSHLRPVRMDQKGEKKKRGSNLSTLFLSNGGETWLLPLALSEFFVHRNSLEQRPSTSLDLVAPERSDNENLFRAFLWRRVEEKMKRRRIGEIGTIS